MLGPAVGNKRLLLGGEEWEKFGLHANASNSLMRGVCIFSHETEYRLRFFTKKLHYTNYLSDE